MPISIFRDRAGISVVVVIGLYAWISEDYRDIGTLRSIFSGFELLGCV